MEFTWNILDIVIAILLAYGFIQGLRHGIIKEIASVVSILLGIYAAKIFSDSVAKAIVDTFSWDESVAVVVSYVLVFVVVAALVGLLARILTKVLRYAMLGWLNRFLGCLFGVIKVALIISVILNVMMFFNVAGDASSKSVLFKPIVGILDQVIPFSDFNKLTDIKLPDIKMPD